MPAMTGSVQCIQIAEGTAFTTIQDAVGDKETFILWFGTTIPSDLDSFTRVVHSMWVSLLREAHSNGLTVTISHPTGSAEVVNVQLGVGP